MLPLYPTDTDNGVTAMTEAMAMGKAVICTRVDGQRDVLRARRQWALRTAGRSRARFVTRSNISGLIPRNASGWDAKGRKRVEQFHTLERFVDGVQSAVDDAIAEVRRS